MDLADQTEHLVNKKCSQWKEYILENVFLEKKNCAVYRNTDELE